MKINLKLLAEAIQTALLLKQATGEILDFKEEYNPDTETISFDIVKMEPVTAQYIEVSIDLTKAKNISNN